MDRIVTRPRLPGRVVAYPQRPVAVPVPTDHILAIVRRRLPLDWAERYNTTPVLIETFVETPRYTGAVYRASGWLHVGTTKGRGRYDRDKLYDKPKKGRLAPAPARCRRAPLPPARSTAPCADRSSRPEGEAQLRTTHGALPSGALWATESAPGGFVNAAGVLDIPAGSTCAP